jgi:hypothetical protein
MALEKSLEVWYIFVLYLCKNYVFIYYLLDLLICLSCVWLVYLLYFGMGSPLVLSALVIICD